MSADQVLVLVAAAGQLVLGLFVHRRGGGSALARQLALLCYVLAAWNFANWAYVDWCARSVPDAGGVCAWRVLDVTLSPWIPPLTLHLVLVFVGARSRHPHVLRLAYVVFGLLSGVSALSGVNEAARRFVDGDAWSATFLVPFLGVLVLSVKLLFAHGRRTHRHGERMRTWFMLLGIGLGGALGTSELLDDLLGVPAMGAIGSLFTTAMFAVVVLRLRMFGRELAASQALYAAGVGLVGLVAYLATIRLAGDRVGLLLLGSVTVGGLLCAAMWPVLQGTAQRRARERRLAGVGRFAEQMAHDLKNPLAALKGAVQFLREERRQGRSIDEQEAFLELMETEIRRVERAMEDYRHLGRCEARPRRTDLEAVVEHVVEISGLAQGGGHSTHLALAPDLPDLRLDPDLVARAVENLVRNACEAMPAGGVVTIRTAALRDAGRRGVVISVEDEGVGMDARQRDRALEEFFTTKSSGSGLGLAYVHAVARAHHGGVDIESRVGEGTRVDLTLLSSEEEAA